MQILLVTLGCGYYRPIFVFQHCSINLTLSLGLPIICRRVEDIAFIIIPEFDGKMELGKRLHHAREEEVVLYR